MLRVRRGFTSRVSTRGPGSDCESCTFWIKLGLSFGEISNEVQTHASPRFHGVPCAHEGRFHRDRACPRATHTRTHHDDTTGNRAAGGRGLQHAGWRVWGPAPVAPGCRRGESCLQKNPPPAPKSEPVAGPDARVARGERNRDLKIRHRTEVRHLRDTALSRGTLGALARRTRSPRQTPGFQAEAFVSSSFSRRALRAASRRLWPDPDMP